MTLTVERPHPSHGWNSNQLEALCPACKKREASIGPFEVHEKDITGKYIRVSKHYHLIHPEIIHKIGNDELFFYLCFTCDGHRRMAEGRIWDGEEDASKKYSPKQIIKSYLENINCDQRLFAVTFRSILHEWVDLATRGEGILEAISKQELFQEKLRALLARS